MKFIFRHLPILILLIVIDGCSSDTVEHRTAQPIPYTVIQKSAFFNKKNMSFSIDSLDNSLLIHLTLNGLKDIPFPINPTYHDTLTNTVFNFDLYSNGKLILSDYCSLRNTLSWKKDSSLSANKLSLCSDTINLRNNNTITIELPFYAFHNLKKGKQSIELKMWQSIFTDQVRIINKDSSYNSYHVYAKQSLLNAQVKFDIQIPAIYKSIICGQGLKLKNDSTFSPGGMDNTLWNSSYPDIYWTMLYPKNKPYARTPYETSTDQYVAHDTFKLYHYYPNDSIGFAVYDHDNLSRDDGLGYWHGSMKSLADTSAGKIAFGNVGSFNVLVQKKGIVN